MSEQCRKASDAVVELLQQLSQGGLGGKNESKQDDAWTEKLQNAVQVSEQECGLVNKTHTNIKNMLHSVNPHSSLSVLCYATIRACRAGSSRNPHFSSEHPLAMLLTPPACGGEVPAGKSCERQHLVNAQPCGRKERQRLAFLRRLLRC